MSNDQKSYIEQEIAEKCEQMRILSLRISEVETQIKSLSSQKDTLISSYLGVREELQKSVDMAKKFLDLEGEWFCSIDQGKLLPVQESQPKTKKSTKKSK